MASNSIGRATGVAAAGTFSTTERRQMTLENSWISKLLSLLRKQCFNCLHDQRLRIATTIISQLSRILDQSLGIESHITALAMVIAVHPDRDVLGICNLVAVVLLTCNL